MLVQEYSPARAARSRSTHAYIYMSDFCAALQINWTHRLIQHVRLSIVRHNCADAWPMDDSPLNVVQTHSITRHHNTHLSEIWLRNIFACFRAHSWMSTERGDCTDWERRRDRRDRKRIVLDPSTMKTFDKCAHMLNVQTKSGRMAYVRNDLWVCVRVWI